MRPLPFPLGRDVVPALLFLSHRRPHLLHAHGSRRSAVTVRFLLFSGEDTLANKETHLQLVNDSRLGAGDGGDDAAESAARAHHVRMEGGRTIDLRDMDHLHKMYS